MHELALSHGIVDLVTEYARREHVLTVTRVVVELGVEAGVEPEALRFCFDVAAENTVVQGATLAIESVPLRARCRGCGAEFNPARMIDPCPDCGAYAPDLLNGRELRVKAFDAE